jgi:hypothetical protein
LNVESSLITTIEEGGIVMSLTTELVTWTWERKCLKTVKSLEKNGFGAIYCKTSREAADYILAAAKQDMGF